MKKPEANEMRSVNLEAGCRHSRVSGMLRYCLNPACGVYYTPLEACPWCSEATNEVMDLRRRREA